MPKTHYLPDERVHFTWDAGNEPVLEIESGDTVVVWTRDVSDNQIGPDSDVSVIAGLDWDRVYPLAGPIVVKGAQPGDTLAVEILDIRTQGWGWTAILPGFGLLPEEFPDAYLRIFDISAGDFAYMREDVAIPLAPFFGTMGVCPAGASAQPIMPPGTFGGNMDTRQLVRGATLYLPVQVENALFSCGDAHGCQGDGEVCVTGPGGPDVRRRCASRSRRAGRSRARSTARPPRSPRWSTSRRSTGPPASAATCTSPRRTPCARWSSTSRARTASAARTRTCSPACAST